MVPAASYPPLQRTQGRGTHSSEVGRENTKSRATRPVVFIYDNRECDACRSKPRMLIVQGEYVAKYLAYCAGWLALAFVVMAVMAGDAFSYYRLRSEGTLTDGTAVATAPHNQINTRSRLMTWYIKVWEWLDSEPHHMKRYLLMISCPFTICRRIQRSIASGVLKNCFPTNYPRCY